MAGRNFVSSFVTGPRVRGDGNKNNISEYITVFGKTLTNASAYLQFRWDWADSNDTSKWSTEQQWYTTQRANRTLSRKRLLVRGSGPALKLSVRSEDGKPFHIVGWSAWDSIDAVP